MADTSPGYLFWRWIRLCDGGTHRTTVTLPKPADSTPAIQIVQNASDITANIVCPDGFGKPEKNMWLIVSQRGAPVYARTLAERTVRFSRKMFSDGIVCFFLADNKMNTISERMVFVLNGKDVYVPDAPIYASPASQGMYRVDLLVPDNLEADCAVSITADNGNDYESTSDIVSTMLLTQELSGVVENPSWYFADRQRMAALDTLMQTQRWRRYDMQAVLKGNPTTTASYPEAGIPPQACAFGDRRHAMGIRHPNGRKAHVGHTVGHDGAASKADRHSEGGSRRFAGNARGRQLRRIV